MTTQLSLPIYPEVSSEVIHGDCLEVMREMADNSFDFIVTDPPYGLHFMGKGWDKFKHYQMESRYVETSRGIEKIRKGQPPNQLAGWYDENRNDEFQKFIRSVGIEMLRILKPGGHIAMFGAPRRHHRQMSGLEDAGFEIRDCIAWIFGQGFPKSHNFGRKLNEDWKGYGTALKPAYEPIIIAMKPLDGTFAQNAEKWGVAGLNIDDSRVQTKPRTTHSDGNHKGSGNNLHKMGLKEGYYSKGDKGRWPANLILDEESAEQLDQMTGNNVSRFFYCAKASSSERNRGLEGIPLKGRNNSSGNNRTRYCTDCKLTDNGSNDHSKCNGDMVNSISKPSLNSHPTVKPIALMKYIIKLLAPPGNPTLLDPFCGSGSTLVAAKELGISCIGIEKEQEYVEIAKARLK